MFMIARLENLFLPFATVSLAVKFSVTYQTRHIIATITLYGPTPNHLSRRLEANEEVNDLEYYKVPSIFIQ